MCAINTFVGDGIKTWYGNGTVNAIRNDFICCHKSLLPSVVSCRIFGVELTESTRVDHKATAVSFHSSTFHFQTSKMTRIHTRATPEASRVLCGDAWRKNAFQQCLPCSVPKHIQIDEAFAEIVAKITETATQRETFRAPICRPSKWWIGAHAWSALQRKRLSLRKFRSDRWQLLCAAFVMFRSATRRGVVHPSNVHEAADIFFMCQRVTRWSKAYFMRVSHESKALVTVDREAHFRSLIEQRKTKETSSFSTS